MYMPRMCMPSRSVVLCHRATEAPLPELQKTLGGRRGCPVPRGRHRPMHGPLHRAWYTRRPHRLLRRRRRGCGDRRVRVRPRRIDHAGREGLYADRVARAREHRALLRDGPAALVAGAAAVAAHEAVHVRRVGRGGCVHVGRDRTQGEGGRVSGVCWRERLGGAFEGVMSGEEAEQVRGIKCPERPSNNK